MSKQTKSSFHNCICSLFLKLFLITLGLLHDVFLFALTPFVFFTAIFSNKIQYYLAKQFKWISNREGFHHIIHASSGEYEFAAPLISELKSHVSNKQIAISFFSNSYIQTLTAEHPNIQILPLPYPSFFWSLLLFKIKKVKTAGFARTDFWPGTLLALNVLNAKTYAFSVCTLTKKQNSIFKLYYLTLGFLLKKIFTTDQETKNQLDTLFKTYIKENHKGSKHKVIHLGNTRSLRIKDRLKTQALEKIAPTFFETFVKHKGQKELLVFGSTWKEDEAVFFPEIKNLQATHTLVICPHEPSRTQQIQEELIKKYNINPKKIATLSDIESRRLISKKDFAQNTNHIVLVDKLGLLLSLYPYTNKVFVGGSFRKKVHSVLEPLLCNCDIFVGPHSKNSEEVCNLKNDKLPITVGENSSDFILWVNSPKKSKTQKTVQDVSLKPIVSFLL